MTQIYPSQGGALPEDPLSAIHGGLGISSPGTAGNVPTSTGSGTWVSSPQSGGLPEDPLAANHGGTGLTTSGADATKFLGSDGFGGFTMATPAGGASPGPFSLPQYKLISNLSEGREVIISPDGIYAYVGGILSSNSHAGVVKVNISTGSIIATCDLGSVSAAGAIYLAISPDGSSVYAVDGSATTKWYKISTGAMTITQASTLANQVSTTSTQPFDLSPDGSIYAYVDTTAQLLYMINTSTYAVTTITVNNSAGGSNPTSVCFYNGSNSNVYIAYSGVANIDLYTTAGVYTSTVTLSSGATPSYQGMRSGLQGNFFINNCNGGSPSIIMVSGGTPNYYPTNSGDCYLAVEILTEIETGFETDLCAITIIGSGVYTLNASGTGKLNPVPLPYTMSTLSVSEGFSGISVTPDGSARLFLLSGTSLNELWSVLPIIANPSPGLPGNILTSDGFGNWVSKNSGSLNNGVVSHNFAGGPSYTLTPTSPSVILVDASGGDVTENLPPSGSSPAGLTYVFIKSDATSNQLFIAPNSTDLLAGVNAPYIMRSYYTSAQGSSLTITNTQEGWAILGTGISNTFGTGALLLNAAISPQIQSAPQLPVSYGGTGTNLFTNGTATFATAGSIAVADATITSGSIIVVTAVGTTNAELFSVVVSAGVGFTIYSSNAASTKVVNWIRIG